MSVQHLAYVLERSTAKNGERLVLLSLANHANERDECYPSHACIAHESGLSVDRVKLCLRQLEQDGRVTRVVNAAPDDRIPRDRRPNLYRLTMVAERPAWKQARAHGGVESSPPGQTSPPRGGRIDSDGGDESPLTGGTKRPPKPSVEPSVEPSPSNASSAPPKESEPRPPKDSAAFAAWWAAYPKKSGKGAARAAYARATKKATVSVLAEGLNRAQRHWLRAGTDPQFIPHPATWLNQERWLDVYANGRPPGDMSHLGANAQ